MTTQICCNCGIQFAVPDHYHWARRKDQGRFFCPNGHGQSYTANVVETLRREKRELEERFQAQLNEANHAKLVAERALDKAIKEKRKVERRIAHGVCPCCNKSFADLSHHMITNHADFRLPSGKTPKQITGSVQ